MGDGDARVDPAEPVIDRWDTVFRTLSAEPRRQLVVSLLDASPEDSVPLPGSAQSPNLPTAQSQFRLELLHNHLPQMADRGFIEWEREPFVASRGPQFDEVAVVLDSLHETAGELPDSLVLGCQRLERERQSHR